MQSLKIELEHCYGIRRLAHTFDFKKCKAVALYAPNGAMKSSLAKTFQDISDTKKSSDRLFTDRVSQRVVVDDTGAEPEPESILVVRPYDTDCDSREKTQTL